MSLTRRWWPALVLAVAVGLAGCGGDGQEALDTRPPLSVLPTVTTTSTTTTTTTTTEVTTTTVATTTSGGYTSFIQFSMPSGNIGCGLDGEFARCDIQERSWTPPAAPADCDADWGHAVAVGTGDAGFICAGDTVAGSPDVLEYGQSVRRGPMQCTSSQSGVTCTNLDTGRGFTLARASYRFF